MSEQREAQNEMTARFDWEDEDGDVGRLAIIDGYVECQIFEGETGRESGVYVTPENARGIVAWLASHVIGESLTWDHRQTEVLFRATHWWWGGSNWWHKATTAYVFRPAEVSRERHHVMMPIASGSR